MIIAYNNKKFPISLFTECVFRGDGVERISRLIFFYFIFKQSFFITYDTIGQVILDDYKNEIKKAIL